MPTELHRFWSKVKRDVPWGECWVWTGKKHRFGYGVFWFRETNMTAHRVSWELTRTPIPRGMVVCHRCDNPPCVNPAHLFLGTVRDNVHDKISKGRDRSAVKLPNEYLPTIHALRAEGLTLREIARRLPVPLCVSQIGNICRGKQRRYGTRTAAIQ